MVTGVMVTVIIAGPAFVESYEWDPLLKWQPSL